MNAKAPWTVKWTEDLSLGIPEIDDEHRRFISQLNTFNDAIRERANQKTLDDMLQDVFATVSAHFRHEEQLFKEYGYEGHEEHAQLHARIILKFEETSAAFSGNISERERIERGLDLKHILVSHLLDEDMKYRGMQNAYPAAAKE